MRGQIVIVGSLIITCFTACLPNEAEQQRQEDDIKEATFQYGLW